MYNLSRYWNKFAYKIIDLGFKLIWDYTGRNQDMIDSDRKGLGYSKEMLTTTYKG